MERYPNVVYCDRDQWQDFPNGTVIGTFAASHAKSGTRFVWAKHAELAPGVMPGDVARGWIAENYRVPIRRRRTQEGYWNVPLRAIPSFIQDAVYIDIRRAFARIVTLAGWDVDYRLSDFLSPAPKELPAWIENFKLIYSMIVSVSARYSSKLDTVKDGTIKRRETRNIYYNPCLFALARDVLACIASDVASVCDVRYIHTDGFIMPSRDAVRALEVIRSWGFDARIKYTGVANVRAVGTYRVGEHASKTHGVEVRHDPSLPSNDEVAWLKKRIRQLARLR